MFQREPFIPASRYLTGALPVLVPDYREMVAGVFKSPDAQDVQMSSALEASQPAPAGELKPEAKERREMDEERLRSERLFLVSRARYASFLISVCPSLTRSPVLLGCLVWLIGVWPGEGTLWNKPQGWPEKLKPFPQTYQRNSAGHGSMAWKGPPLSS